MKISARTYAQHEVAMIKMAAKVGRKNAAAIINNNMRSFTPLQAAVFIHAISNALSLAIEQTEQLRTPARLMAKHWRERAELHSKLALASSVLSELEIEHRYVVVAFHGREHFSHCYLRIASNKALPIDTESFTLNFCTKDPFEIPEGITKTEEIES